MVNKQKLLNEIREIFDVVVFLFVSFSVLATFKSLILIQQGVDYFLHGYMQAIVTALALGKVVFLAQKLPILNALDEKPALYAVLYKALLFTIITALASRLEEMLFESKLMHQVDNMFPVLAYLTHELAMFLVFIVLFIFRELDTTLGEGRMREIFLKPRPKAKK